MVKSIFKLHGETAHTLTLHEKPDISNICQYEFYQWVYHCDHTALFPHNKEVLRRVLSPVHGEGNKMCQWVLEAYVQVVLR